ncbi:hypothetical protein K469DRAFT_174686 [Zopfia rhizophila CBS 207.26]|uniref:Uncharacterized protein n=1 Tax=Zopfia rhizophila CBS 207.26 TaxID=1314779 RepID=A0A6A6DYS3_9PEZI|nr:hypothetical protein K469DRAFT_174686 [Zopfia rhizophila CBS 207.26]
MISQTALRCHSCRCRLTPPSSIHYGKRRRDHKNEATFSNTSTLPHHAEIPDT